MAKRLIWNVISEPHSGDPPRQEGYFGIRGAPSQIEKMRQRIREELKPTDEESVLTDKTVEGSGESTY